MSDGESFEYPERKYGGGSTFYDEMSLIEKIKKVLFSPSEFFERIKVEKGIGRAFKYLAILSLINLVVEIVSLKYPIPLWHIPAILGIATPIVKYIGRLILSFVGAGLTHLFAKLLKGKGDYSATYKAQIYASTPILLLGWIRWVGIIFAIYSFYLSLKGISKLHEVSMIRAFVIILMTGIVMALASISVGAIYICIFTTS